jgi:hypothetical protein
LYKIQSRSGIFLSYRNNLNKILDTPYSPWNTEWEIGVQKFVTARFGSIITLHVIQPPEVQTPREHLMAYWGRQYERLCTLPSDDPANGEFITLSLAQLNSHRLLLAAEIDCQIPPNPQSNKRTKSEHFSAVQFCPEPNLSSRYLELKTAKLPESDKEKSGFGYWKLR